MNPEFLREAICLSFEKMTAGEGGLFGAVVVRNGKIVGRGWNDLQQSPGIGEEEVRLIG